MFKVSYYNFKTFSEDGTFLIYNTRTGAFLGFNDNKTKEEALKILSLNTVNSNSSVIEALYKHGFLINDGFNEIEQIKQRYIKFVNNSKELHLTLLPSENCNFRCPYCFIYDRRGISMKEKVYKSVLSLINKRIKDINHLMIEWFGGEPTLEKSNILKFMGEIKDVLKKYPEVKFSSTMYTNGYLLTPESFFEYFNSGITFFQVTLDGNKKSHDKLRFLQNGQGTFDTIWKNICDIKKLADKNVKFNFRIRVNFIKGQDEDMRELVENYKEVFGSDNRFSIYFRMVSDMETSRNDVKSIACEIYDTEEGFSKQMEYQFYMYYKLGKIETKTRMISPLPDPIGGWCHAQKKNSYIIGADGLVFKCDTLIGDKSTAYGKLMSDGTIESFNKIFEWDKSIYDSNNSKCISCKFLPICQGGCPRYRKDIILSESCYYTEGLIEKAMKETHLFYKTHPQLAI